MHLVKLLPLLAALALTFPGTSRLRAAEPAPLYEMGKPFEIRLAMDTNLVLSLDSNNFCSWKPAGRGMGARFQFTRGLADPTQTSLEVVGQTNVFLRHFFLRLRTLPMPSRRDVIFEGDATFDVVPGLTPKSRLLRCFNFRDAYIGRSHQDKAYTIPDPHPEDMDLLLIYK